MRVIIENERGDFVEGDPAARWGRSVKVPLLVGEDGLTGLSEERLIVRSGRLPTEDEPEQPDPRTWGVQGWRALEEIVARLAGREGARVLIRPAATDVVSDAPSCLRLLERRGEWGGGRERVGLLLDPVAMLAPSMIGTAEDHVRRILELVGSRAGVDAVAVSNVELRNGVPGRSVLHRGIIDVGRLVEAVRACVPAETPLVLAGGEIDRQRGALLG